MRVSPGVKEAATKFWTVVDDDLFRIAAFLSESFEDGNHRRTRQRPSHLDR